MLARDGEAVEVEGLGGYGVAALFGGEAELGQDHGRGDIWCVAHLVVPFEHLAQVRFGDVELAFSAGQRAGRRAL